MNLPKTITKEETVSAVEALCLDEFNHPYFFLFADIDTKDPESLLSVLKFYRINHLSCYYYETAKGWHVLSPCMIKFRAWTRLRERLSNLLESYHFDALRISHRYGDSFQLFFDMNNDKRFKESINLHSLICNKFQCLMPEILKGRFTKLRILEYKQLIFDQN